MPRVLKDVLPLELGVVRAVGPDGSQIPVELYIDTQNGTVKGRVATDPLQPVVPIAFDPGAM